MREGRLILANGWVATGFSFGAHGRVAGRLAPHTEMTGYQEVLADPACRGQIVCMTYPLIGNVGVDRAEGNDRPVQALGLVVREPQRLFSSWSGSQSLPDWVQSSKTIALGGVDTREVMRQVREQGAMPAVLTTVETDDAAAMAALAAAAPVSGTLLPTAASPVATLLPLSPTPDGPRICVLDMGMPAGFCDALRLRGCTVQVLPWHANARTIDATRAEGLVVSTGPACTPAEIEPLIQTIRSLAATRPVLGVGTGFHALAMANGWQPRVMRHGHHGANLPVRDVATGRVYITKQNHWLGFPADVTPADPEHAVTWVHINDNEIEGARFSPLVSGVQFTPDSHTHPFGTGYVWDQFLQAVKG